MSASAAAGRAVTAAARRLDDEDLAFLHLGLGRRAQLLGRPIGPLDPVLAAGAG